MAAHNARCDDPQPSGKVLPATAVVHVLTAGGAVHTARALVDQGSEGSFVSESLAQRLRLPHASASVSITGIGAQSAGTCRGRVASALSSRVDARFELKVQALVLPRLTSYAPPQNVSGARWTQLDGLTLADPDLFLNLAIVILLSADVFHRLLLPAVKKGPIGSPIAQNTYLGLILSGLVSPHPGTGASCSASISLSTTCSFRRCRDSGSKKKSRRLPR